MRKQYGSKQSQATGARGTEKTVPTTSRTPPRPRLKKRRLTVDDVNVVDRPMLRKALGGTIVGNTMEWYDVGVFGWLGDKVGRQKVLGGYLGFAIGAALVSVLQLTLE